MQSELFWWPRTVAVVVAVLLSACASGPPPIEPVSLGDDAAVRRQVQALMDHALKAGGLASLAVTVVDARGEVFAEARGLADAATGRPATPDTLYRMGSVSKLFTDAAALALVQQRRLALDTPLPQALPCWTWTGAPAWAG
jgi:CubicO group peptidase (beta-lactamase class C family)